MRVYRHNKWKYEMYDRPNKAEKKYQVGDTVYVRLKRYADGSGTSYVNFAHPDHDTYPVHKCVIAQVDVGGAEGVYGLEWADSREPIGLPFYASAFCDADGKPV